MDTSFLSVNESHIFVWPQIDFIGQASGAQFVGPELKLPSQGDWWIWGMMATLVNGPGGSVSLPACPWGLNIWDPALGQFWWTGGALAAGSLLPINCVAGKAGEPAVFTEPKLVKGGSILVPYLAQYSALTPTKSSPAYIALVATLANSARGALPVVPSLGGVVNERKGLTYKSLITAPFSVQPLDSGGSAQFVIPLNKNSSMIISNITSDYGADHASIPFGAYGPADQFLRDPRTIEQNILMNVFDTRTTWKWASPTGLPLSMMMGQYGARPFAAPSFFYMEADQNLVLQITNNSGATMNTDLNVVFDGFLNQNILGERIR